MARFARVSSPTSKCTSTGLNGTRHLDEAIKKYLNIQADDHNEAKSRRSAVWQQYKVTEAVDQRQARLERVKNCIFTYTLNIIS